LLLSKVLSLLSLFLFLFLCCLDSLPHPTTPILA
jgi:hypothetical protein